VRSAKLPHLDEIDHDELEEYLRGLFSIADTDGDGELESHEFSRLMSMSGFGISEHMHSVILKDADVNGDGTIAEDELGEVAATLKRLAEFEAGRLLMLPTRIQMKGCQVLQAGITGWRTRDKMLPFLGEIEPEKLKEYIQDLCANEDGIVEAEDFADLMYASGFAFSEHMYRVIKKEADANGDGKIDMKELGAVVATLKRLAAIESANLLTANSSENKGKACAKTQAGIRGWVVRKAKLPFLDEIDPEELKESLIEICGFPPPVDADEFAERLYESGFAFSEHMHLVTKNEADENNDGRIGKKNLAVVVEIIKRLAAIETASLLTAPSRDQMKGCQVLQAGIRGKKTRKNMLPFLDDIEPAKLEEYIQDLCANEDGIMEAEDFADLMYASGFAFSEHMYYTIKREADANGDGVIDKKELGAVVATLKRLARTEQANILSAQSSHMKGIACKVVQAGLRGWETRENMLPFLDEIEPEELKEYIQELCENEDGVMVAEEFADRMYTSGIAFSEHMYHVIKREADDNGDGTIDTNELGAVVATLKRLDAAEWNSDVNAPSKALLRRRRKEAQAKAKLLAQAEAKASSLASFTELIIALATFLEQRTGSS